MFFEPRYHKALAGAALAITPLTQVEIAPCAGEQYIRKSLTREFSASAAEGSLVCRKLTFALGIPDALKAEIGKTLPVSGNREEYVLSLGEESFVYATEECGLLYGLATLVQLADHGELCPTLLYDYPACPVRGYRVYMPGPETIDIFKEMIDLIAYYKYNAIILEVGGAMEYKRHPEINEKWVEFCDDMRLSSTRASEMHRRYSYRKNSVHCENGDGKFLTQEQCRDIAAYCRERGLEVIPECPTLSHADYLLLPHPEFAERENDEVPDAYCPRHPGIYQYVFEVLDEVIDVFQPSRINIGHDEYYSFCICPRCKGKDHVETYINDVRTLADYLESRGIGTLMWGEKLLKAISPSGKHYGGWYDDKVYPDGTVEHMPDMYSCADKMPRNVTFLNWYWEFGTHLDRVYHDNGYPMLFGNFNALKCEDYRQRINWGCLGGFVSNWGSNEPEYMQRNCQYYQLIGTAYAFWSPTYDSPDRELLDRRLMKENYRRQYKGKKHLIRVVHNTDRFVPYKPFWCGIFIEDEQYLMGNYVATYADGTTASFPVKLGTNITVGSSDVEAEFDPDTCSENSHYREVSGSTLPILENGEMFYECGFENPYPEKQIVDFSYHPLPGNEQWQVKTLRVSY